MAGGRAALLQIFLVVFFRAIERASRCDLRGDGPLEFSAGLQRCARLLGRYFLLWRMEENRSTVLCAKVRPLTVHLRRVVDLPESFEQLLISHFRRIKRYLDHFPIPVFIPANILLSRMLHLPAAVTYRGIDYSGNALKCGFHAPKTSRSKSRNLCHGITSSRKFLSYSTCTA